MLADTSTAPSSTTSAANSMCAWLTTVSTARLEHFPLCWACLAPLTSMGERCSHLCGATSCRFLRAVERKLDAARELLAEASTDEERPGLPGAYFTDTTLVLRTATAFTEAGNPSRSALMFGEVLANSDLSRRDAGFFRAWRSAALALSGEPDEAATVGLESVEMAVATSSRRTLRVLAEVMGT